MDTKKQAPSRFIMSVATWGLALLAMNGFTGCADSGQGGDTGQGGVASPVAPPQFNTMPMWPTNLTTPCPSTR